MKLRPILTALCAVSALSFTASVASAQQPWISDRRYGEGVGIRVGNLELHPGLAAEFGYDSNWFQRSDNEPQGTVAGGTGGRDPEAYYRLRITPHLTLSTLSPQRRQAEGMGGEPPKLNFQLGVYGAYNELFNADSDHAPEDDGSEQRHVNAGAQFALDVLPNGPIGFDLYGNFVRRIEPSNSPDENFAFDRHSFRLGAGANWRPGGGLFSWRLGYDIAYHAFLQEVFEQPFNNARHTIKSRTSWKFLPRTALISDAEYALIRFSNPDQTSQNDGETLQGRIGINGLVSNHFGVLAMGGWGASFYDDNENGFPARNYDGPVGQAEVRWYITPAPTLEATSAMVGLSSIALGYNRTFTTSYLGTFFARDRAYLNFSYFIGGVFLVAVDGGLSWIPYPDTFIDRTGTPELLEETFTEKRIDAQIFGEYRFSDAVGINTTLRYDQNISREVGTPPVDDLDFQRFQAYLGLRLFY
jgi:hypothetical protein